MRRDAAAAHDRRMRRNPVLIVSALLAALGPLVGNGLYAGPDGEGEALLASLRAGLDARATLALSLELAGFVGLCVLLGSLAAAVAPSRPRAAAVTVVAGAAMIAVKLGSAAPMMTAHRLADDLDAGTATALLDLNEMAFVVSGLLLSLALAAAGIGLLGLDVPSWTGWAPAVLGSLGVVAGGAGIIDPDAYVPVPFLLLLVWMLALAIWSAVARPASVSTRADARVTTMSA